MKIEKNNKQDYQNNAIEKNILIGSEVQFKLQFCLITLYIFKLNSMHFSTKEKSYGGQQGTGRTGSEAVGQESVTNATKQSQSNVAYRVLDRKQGTDAKRGSLIEVPKNEELFESFPQLNIHRVDSAEHREKQKSSQQSGGGYQAMTTSLIAKPYNRGDSKLTSTSVQKTSTNYYTNTRENFSSNQSDTNKASYRLNYATYKKQGVNLAPNYNYGANSEDGSDNQAPTYKRIGNVMTMERMDLEISPKMVSSVISRESSNKDGNQDKGGQRVYLSTSSRNRDENKGEGEEAYEMFASRHPNESIRRSTIEISKAISSNAITQLQRTNENQQKKIKKLQKQLQQFKNSLKKWDEIKHRYQMDLESKSRQIFDLERVNKRLTQEVQGIRAYRTMETVEQVIIVRLKEEIMQLNKKIIQMQADHYKNQKSLLEKQSKKDSSKGEVQNDKETIKKLQEAVLMNKKESELLGIELQKEKEKSWNLQREKEQYEAGKTMDKENYERELTNNKKEILALRQEVQRHVETIRVKQIDFEGVKVKSDQEIKKLNERLSKQVEESKKALESQNNSVGSQLQKLQEQLAEKQKLFNQKQAQQRRNFEKELGERLVQKQNECRIQFSNQLKAVQSQSNNKTALEVQRLNAQLSEKDKLLFDQKKTMQREANDRELRFNSQIAEKDRLLEQKLNEQKKAFEKEINDKESRLSTQLLEKDRILDQKLLEQRRNFEKEFNERDSKLSSQLLEKDRVLDQKLQEQKRAFDKEMNDRLYQKEQEYKVTLNNEMRLFESKIVEQGKSEKLKESEQKQMLDRLRAEKEQGEAQLKKKIAEVEDSLRATNQRLAQKDQQIRTIESKDKNMEQVANEFRGEIDHLRGALVNSENYIVELQNENQNIKNAIRERDIEIDHLKADNLKIIDDLNREINEKAKWKQQEIFIIENQVKAQMQETFKVKEKELEAKVASVNNMEQSVKQMKVKLEQEQQQQAIKIQAELKEKEQKVQAEVREKEQQSIKQLQTTKVKLTDEVKKAEVNLSTINKEVSAITSKKSQVESELSLKQREVREIETKITEIKVQLQVKLTQLSQADSQRKSAQAEAQRLKEAEEREKSSNKEMEGKYKQMEAKYNSTLSELNSFKVEFGKLEQKARQNQIELNRATENLNTWKSKSDTLESLTNKLKGDFTKLEKEKDELIVKAKDAEQNKLKSEIAKKYTELLPEYELLQQKLKIKQEQIASRESAYLKVRQHTESGESKANSLAKEVRNLSNKLDQTESKLKAILSKVEIEEYKYKQLYDKMVADTQVYMNFIKKLQEDNELIAQKYWKIRKLVKKEKINDENDMLEKHDYATYRQFLEHQILTHFKKMIIPAFEAKILQKIGACEASISHKSKRLAAVKSMAEYVKRRRQAERARLKN